MTYDWRGVIHDSRFMIADEVPTGPASTCLVLFLVLFLSPIFLSSQEARIKGVVLDAQGLPVEAVNVSMTGSTKGVTTDDRGRFEIAVPHSADVEIIVSHLGYASEKRSFRLSPGEETKWEMKLKSSETRLEEVTVSDESKGGSTMVKIDPRAISSIPNPSGGVEAMLKTLPGVVSTNELSSTYAVRGGNFDENLIYVNDVEVYRPQLYTSGQQEGLSFINPKMVSSLAFSAGGYEARYGDKMSSVLDVRYKKPYSFGTSVDLSLLGFDVHTEGSAVSHRLKYLFGARQRRNNYLLKTLDTKGQYQPVFTDAQMFLSWNFTEKWEISALGNVAYNKYRFIPDIRETEFGTLQQSLQLTVYFDGQEISNYQTYFGSVTNTFRPDKNNEIVVIFSGVRSLEDEASDVMGQYFINEADKDDGNPGNATFQRGVGTYLDHARNYLTIDWLNSQFIWRKQSGKHSLEGGGQYRAEFIDDRLSEWVLLDSAGFNLPKSPDYPGDSADRSTNLTLYQRLRASNEIQTFRSSVYFQDVISWSPDNASAKTLAIGARLAHWTFNDEFIFSPRATFTLKPKWRRNYRFHFASGVYQQQPFYREMRNLEGELNPGIRSQKSIHFIAGSQYTFPMWNRPFKFSTELYFKLMDDLVPYIIDNVRVRYYGTNNSHGYATGVDFRLNGEFVRNAESWFSLSLMQTREDIEDDFIISSSGEVSHPGYIPRPTDQTVNFSIFFQDYLPRNPSLKFNLTVHYATGLAFGPPESPKYLHTARIPPYRRIDIGLSKRLLSDDRKRKDSGVFRHMDSAWLSLDVFNLPDIDNTISYLWVKDVTNTTYAVPNYLTGRLVNLRLSMNF